jgi:hypothetical protein
MWARAICALSLVILMAIVNAIGCGGDDLVVGSSQPRPPTASSTTPTPTGGEAGDACLTGSDCRSGRCDPVFLECQ